MARFSSARRLLPRPIFQACFFALGFVLAGCGSDDAAAPPAAAGTGGTAGSAGGQGGSSGQGGGTGGTSATGGVGSSGGSRAGAGAGARSGSGNSAGSGGSGSPGSGGAAAGSAGRAGPPEPSDDGSSPYERECHGDTAMCVDVEALRCLGIRDDTTIYGYSCSNTCETDADCSDAPASGEAKAGCVDFVTQKHCLLVCMNGSAEHACPDGMSCYVYPQTTIGYCLWQ